jgi:hypothetical protein
VFEQMGVGYEEGIAWGASYFMPISVWGKRVRGISPPWDGVSRGSERLV